MIVAGPDGFEKGEYRKFNIKSTELTPGDDYAMMREVLTRRFARLVKEEDDPKTKWPDVALIDGGPGQLAIARQVFADLGVEDVLLAAISKGPDRDAGREHFYLPGREPFRLDPRSPVLYYLQRLRDEAHRFAIGSHRKKRSKAIGANPLDEIAGVGASRKRALLQHFGSAKSVAGASVADLESVGGVSATLARKIYDFFHPNP
jgi:excinuclease ABC subunit C